MGASWVRRPLTLGLCAATMMVLLLAGCGPDRPPRPGSVTGPSTTAVRSTRPPVNGIAARPAKEILVATERAFRSARSVQVKVTFKDSAGVVKANLTMTHKHGMAAGWFEQQGVRFIRKSTATVGRLPAVRLWAVDGSYYVAATGKPYPLLLDHGGDDLDTAFSNYDRNVTIRAPRGALDLKKLVA